MHAGTAQQPSHVSALHAPRAPLRPRPHRDALSRQVAVGRVASCRVDTFPTWQVTLTSGHVAVGLVIGAALAEELTRSPLPALEPDVMEEAPPEGQQVASRLLGMN